jgi:hypothetical protein
MQEQPEIDNLDSESHLELCAMHGMERLIFAYNSYEKTPPMISTIKDFQSLHKY